MPIDPRRVVAEALAAFYRTIAALPLRLPDRCARCGHVNFHVNGGRQWCLKCGAEVEQSTD